MDADDWEDAEECSVRIPLVLVKRLTHAIIQALNEWHMELGEETFDTTKASVAILVGAEAAIDLINGCPEEGETVQ